MKNAPLPFKKIEWWLITLLFLAIVLINALDARMLYYRPDVREIAEYFAKLGIPLLMFLGFYLIHIKILPRYLKDQKLIPFIGYSLLVFVPLTGAITAFSIGAEFTETILMPFYFNTVAIYIGYLVLVYILIQIVHPPRLKDFQVYNLFRITALYFFVLLFLYQIREISHMAILFFYGIILPSIVLVILYNYFFIFRMKRAGKTKQARWYLSALIFTITAVFFVLAINQHGKGALLVGGLVLVVILLVVIPISSLIFTKYDAFLSKISNLTYKVDQGSADLDFLKSQINPHFLFNVLNTLYGTALQEKAENTASGIQKLGDMMRFMLHENHQDLIPIQREKEYLTNYVDLQLLRISQQENIEILFNTKDEDCQEMIAPMLLIPFVENAFKHGISQQKKSWVKISLRCQAGALHLDVNNSIHRSGIDDPEKKNSGIGLENVRQRLNLLYPDRHELVIRENDLEYFVHLSLQLNSYADSNSH